MPALPYKGSPLSSPQPISGVLSLPTNKNQTLLFPADDAAPKVGCQLPLKQQEHQGTLQEPGTMPAALILPGNLYKALFEIYLYTVRDIDTDIYWFQVTNNPSQLPPFLLQFHWTMPDLLPLLLHQAVTWQRKGHNPQKRATSWSQIFPCYVIIIIILKIRHVFYHFSTANSTHQNYPPPTQKKYFKNLKTPPCLHGY